MLEKGHQVLGCRVDDLISSNAVYDTYAATAADSAPLRLLQFKTEALGDAVQRQAALARANRLASQRFPDVALPLKAGEFDEQLVCLWPERAPTLQELFQARYPQREALSLVRRIAIALRAPHAAGFSHGALSPQKVCLQSGAPVLADFALGTLCRLDFDSGIDPHYVSPEQVRGEEQSAASDIYSLGCLLHLLLSGKPPFAESDNLFVALQRQDEDFPFLPDDERACQPLVDKMVALHAGERPTAEHLIAEIDALLVGAAEDAVPPAADLLEPIAAAGDVTPEDEASSTMIAAKIEARLQALAQADTDTDADAAAVVPMTAADARQAEMQVAGVSDGLGEPVPQRRSSPSRHLLLLLLGVLIGVLVYALVFDRQHETDQGAGENARQLTLADMGLGVELWRQGEFDPAAAEFLRLIGISPDDPRPYNNLAAVYASQGDYQRARMTLEQALGTDNDYDIVYHNLASVYAEMARDSYGKALQLSELKRRLDLEVFSNHGALSVAATGEMEVTGRGGEEVALEPVAAAAQAEGSAAVLEQPEVPSTGSVAEQPAAVEPVVMAVATSVDQPGAQIAEAVAEVAVATLEPAAELREIQTFLEGWAAAWASQNVEAYLDHYSVDFVPSGGVTLERWKQQRRNRLATPSAIQVALDNIVLAEKTADSLIVDVEQTYQSDVYSDLTQKRFELRPEADGYRILRERSFEVIR
jgi:tetratricopeptide (TPR) repeat protein